MKYTKEIPITPNNTPSTPTKTPSTPNKSPIMPKKAPSSPNKKRCFVARQFLSRIYAFFGVPFRGLKNMVAYQKWQIWGMSMWLYVTMWFIWWICAGWMWVHQLWGNRQSQPLPHWDLWRHPLPWKYFGIWLQSGWISLFLRFFDPLLTYRVHPKGLWV